MNEEVKPYEEEPTSIKIAGYDPKFIGKIILISVVCIFLIRYGLKK